MHREGLPHIDIANGCFCSLNTVSWMQRTHFSQRKPALDTSRHDGNNVAPAIANLTRKEPIMS